MITSPALVPLSRMLAAQVDAVHLFSASPSLPAAEHWPVGYTMTVWGVAIGVVVLISLVITTWMHFSPYAKALVIQTVTWRISPHQFWALRSVAIASGTPVAVMLVSRGAFESAIATWASDESPAPAPTWARKPLALLFERVHGVI